LSEVIDVSRAAEQGCANRVDHRGHDLVAEIGGRRSILFLIERNCLA